MPHRVQFNTEDIDHSLAPYWTPLDSEDDTKEQKSAAFQAWLNKNQPESAQNNNDFFTSDIFCWKKESPVFSKYLARPGQW